MMTNEDDTPRMIAAKAGRKGNFFVVYPMGNPFGKTDSLFGYATTRGALPGTIMHGSGMRTLKNRAPNVKKDNREKVEVRFGDEVMAYERTVYRTYRELVEQKRDAFHLPDTWRIALVRAEEDRIIVECRDGADPF
jgi:hypothetical protein